MISYIIATIGILCIGLGVHTDNFQSENEDVANENAPYKCSRIIDSKNNGLLIQASDPGKESPWAPSLLFTLEEISQIEAAVSDSSDGSSLHTAYRQLMDRCSDGLTNQPKVYEGSDPFEYYHQILKQAALTRDLTLGYRLSGNQKYAEKAIDILSAWASGCTGITYDMTAGTGMLLSRSTYPAMCAYDLLKGTQYIDDNTTVLIEGWLTGLVPQIINSIDNWEQNNYFNKQDYQNHVVAHSMGLLALGYLLDDPDLVYFALASPENPRNIYELITGCILMEGDEVHHREPANAPSPENGEIYDRYRHHTASNRGLQYAHLTTTLLTISARICYNNGLDLFDYTAPTGENLRLVFEYYSDFYRLMDSCIKSGFYCGETHRIGRVGDDHGMFEIGHRHYPDSQPLKELLASGSFNRGTCYMDILGLTRFYSAIISDDESVSNQKRISREKKTEIKIYPNPATDKIRIEIPGAFRKYAIVFYNQQGQAALKKEIEKSTEIIDVSGLPPGIYNLRVYNEEFTHTDKTIIIR